MAHIIIRMTDAALLEAVRTKLLKQGSLVCPIAHRRYLQLFSTIH